MNKTRNDDFSLKPTNHQANGTPVLPGAVKSCPFACRSSEAAASPPLSSGARLRLEVLELPFLLHPAGN